MKKNILSLRASMVMVALLVSVTCVGSAKFTGPELSTTQLINDSILKSTTETRFMYTNYFVADRRWGKY